MHENRMSCEKLGVGNALLDIRDALERVFDRHNQAITLLKNLVACLYNRDLEWRTVAEEAEFFLLDCGRK